MTLEGWVSNNGCGMTVRVLLILNFNIVYPFIKELILIMIFIVIK